MKNEKRMSFLAFDMEQKLMFPKMNNKQALCLLNKWILTSQTKCCHRATVSHQLSELLMASQQPVLLQINYLPIHPSHQTIVTSSIAQAKSQSPCVLKLMFIPFWESVIFTFRSHEQARSGWGCTLSKSWKSSSHQGGGIWGCLSSQQRRHKSCLFLDWIYQFMTWFVLLRNLILGNSRSSLPVWHTYGWCTRKTLQINQATLVFFTGLSIAEILLEILFIIIIILVSECLISRLIWKYSLCQYLVYCNT